jgi:hypothetical protein
MHHIPKNAAATTVNPYDVFVLTKRIEAKVQAKK